MKYMPLPASSASRRATSAIVVWPKTLRRAPTPSAQMPPASSACGADFAVEGLDDLEHGDLFGRPREGVAAAHPAVAGEETGAAEGREELLEELLGDVPAFRKLFDRHRPLPRSGELGERNDRIARL